LKVVGRCRSPQFFINPSFTGKKLTMTRTILIVEDNQADRSRLEKLLSDAGYLVSTAENGTQALAAAKRSKPDAILMDVNMPEMDGFAATRALRGDAGTKAMQYPSSTPRGCSPPITVERKQAPNAVELTLKLGLRESAALENAAGA